MTTHNDQANRINEIKLKRLPEKEIKFEALIEGEFPDHMIPAEKELVLKKDSQVTPPILMAFAVSVALAESAPDVKLIFVGPAAITVAKTEEPLVEAPLYSWYIFEVWESGTEIVAKTVAPEHIVELSGLMDRFVNGTMQETITALEAAPSQFPVDVAVAVTEPPA